MIQTSNIVELIFKEIISNINCNVVNKALPKNSDCVVELSADVDNFVLSVEVHVSGSAARSQLIDSKMADMTV